ncbi:hypothetical protein UFOVP238_54 [uncultured Caudovirales phage]|uniref:Minor capsid protein n=1 Tax=uncultured Caudovirales phage TaxID=2100421 RepID=A0A6J7WUD0_9CAUD|nr:hypothetical protein UFOVP238_54 [uncultured Caudovirales phage]
MESDLYSLLNRTVVFRNTAGYDAYGKPSYRDTTVAARIDSFSPTTWDDKGNVTSLSGTLWCEVTPSISLDSRVTIDGVTAKVSSFKIVYDDQGPHHVKVTFA